jgi:hypothetical protein
MRSEQVSTKPTERKQNNIALMFSKFMSPTPLYVTYFNDLNYLIAVSIFHIIFLTEDLSEISTGIKADLI